MSTFEISIKSGQVQRDHSIPTTHTNEEFSVYGFYTYCFQPNTTLKPCPVKIHTGPGCYTTNYLINHCLLTFFDKCQNGM